MADDKKEFRLKLSFVEPEESIMSIARRQIDSPDENYRSVAKALIDVTNEAHLVQRALIGGGNPVLDPFLDFWFGDAVDCAGKLLHYSDADARVLATCLIELEKSVIKAKEDFLGEAKRMGIRFGK